MKPITAQFCMLMLISMSIFTTSCLKEENTGPFAGTKYEKLGNFNKNGVPDYLTAPDVLSPTISNAIEEYMLDGRNMVEAYPQFFTTDAIADIEITKPSTVYMTFVHQETDGGNALGFYTYPTNNVPKTAKDIKKIIYAFPSAGNATPLKAGDKIKLGTFSEGVSIGFVLLVNAWDKSNGTLNTNTVHYCTNDALNPEKDPGLKKHAVLIPIKAENKILVGFEDQDRSLEFCDHDFNDVVFYCTVAY